MTITDMEKQLGKKTETYTRVLFEGVAPGEMLRLLKKAKLAISAYPDDWEKRTTDEENLGLLLNQLSPWEDEPKYGTLGIFGSPYNRVIVQNIAHSKDPNKHWQSTYGSAYSWDEIYTTFSVLEVPEHLRESV